MTFKHIITALIAGAIAGPALAETDVSLSILREEIQTRVVDGETVETQVQEPVTSAIPGEALIYRIRLENSGPESAEDISMVLPIDPSLTIIPDSLTGKIEFEKSLSVDGGKTFGRLDDLTVQENNSERPATISDATHLKIDIPLLSEGQSTRIDYRVTVK